MRIAVLADSHLQRKNLREVLGWLGYEIVMNADPSQLEPSGLQQCATDVWLVSLQCMDSHQQLLLEQLYGQNVPVLVDEGTAPLAGSEDYPRWQRNLQAKLSVLDKKLTAAQSCQALPGPDLLTEPAGEPAEQVWLLAASLGGPAAVKEFLDALPASVPVGFLYAQHINQEFEKSLPRAVGRHSQWPVRLAQHNDYVRRGEVVVVPVSHELAFADGRMQCCETPWRGSYAPSIEQMMLNLAAGFGPRSGTIIFSGMGGDGSAACDEVVRRGMQIWAQDSRSSACSSMPDSVRQTGQSSYSGSPQELAVAMLNHVG